MQFLRQNTAVIVTVGPFYDKTDGVTIETALTITNERITLTADTDAGSAPTNILDNVTGATSGTDNDLNYITGNDAGMMQLELSAANTNRVGRMLLSITDAANHVPVFHEYFVLPQVIFDWLTAGAAPLTPTVAGRTLDVSATGEAGIDWGNVGSPTTTVGLSGTTVKTATDVETDTADIQTRIPAALVSGRIDASVGAMAANVLTATAINADAITAAKVAADVSAEIADAVWDEDATAHQTQGTFGQAIGDPVADTNTIFKAVVTDATGATVGEDAAAILADTGTDGVVVASIATGAVTAAAIADGAIDAATFAAGAITAGAIAADAIGASELAADAVNEIADQVWDEVLSGHLTAGTTGNALNAAGSAGDPWSTAIPGAYGAGTAGKILGDNINATISSRASQTSLDTVDDFLDTEVAAILADTNELQTDWANGGRLDLLIDAILEDTGTTLDDFLDTEIAAIKAKTDQLTFTSANKVDSSLQAAGDVVAAVANKIADHVLRRTYANARASSDGDTLAFRSLIGAVGKLVNRWYFSGGNLLTTHEDDTTTFGTQAVTTDAAAEPITELNTA